MTKEQKVLYILETLKESKTINYLNNKDKKEKGKLGHEISELGFVINLIKNDATIGEFYQLAQDYNKNKESR